MKTHFLTGNFCLKRWQNTNNVDKVFAPPFRAGSATKNCAVCCWGVRLELYLFHIYPPFMDGAQGCRLANKSSKWYLLSSAGEPFVISLASLTVWYWSTSTVDPKQRWNKPKCVHFMSLGTYITYILRCVISFIHNTLYSVTRMSPEMGVEVGRTQANEPVFCHSAIKTQ